MSISTPTETVKQIGRLNLSGNVIPSNWWKHIKLPSGKPDSTAIILLSDIVYWYRPSEIRDEVTGELKGWRKRFHGDKLQRSYQAFANQFGFSKRETTDALKRLRAAGLITLELRTVTTSEGTILNNVLYVEVVPEAIYTITNNTSNQVDEDAKSGTPITFERNTPYVETEPLLHPDVRAPTLKSDTYTEITTESTHKKINKKISPNGSRGLKPDKQVSASDPKVARLKIPFEEIRLAYNEIVGEKLPKAESLNDKRKRALTKFWKELKAPSIDVVKNYFGYFLETAGEFYFGENDRGWRASFDYLIRPDTVLKTREGTL